MGMRERESVSVRQLCSKRGQRVKGLREREDSKDDEVQDR